MAAAAARRAREEAKRHAQAEAKAKEAQEREDNQGRLVESKIRAVKAELRGLLKGAPRVVKNTLASDYGTAMRPRDYEISAWFSGKIAYNRWIIGC